MASRAASEKRWAAALLALLAARLLWVVTYPLNIAGDGGAFYSMTFSGQSSLVYPTGYPFLFGLAPRLIRSWLAWRGEAAPRASLPTERPDSPPSAPAPRALATVKALFRAHEPAVQRGLLVLHHAIDLAATMALAGVLRRRFGELAAAGPILYGLDPRNLAEVSTTRPEWLMGTLLALAAVAACEAFLAPAPRAKVALYLASAALLSWSFLLKLLTAPFALAYLFLVWRERMGARARAGLLAAIAAVFAANVLLFEVTYHRPATGTGALTFARGLKLHDRLIQESGGRGLDPRNGPATKRLLLIKAAHPQGAPALEQGFVFHHVDAVPASDRAPLRERYRVLEGTSDRELSDLLERAGPIAAVNIRLTYQLLGLRETDELVRSAFGEEVRARPGRYAHRVLLDMARSPLVARPVPRVPLFAPAAGADDLNLIGPDGETDRLAWGFRRYDLRGRRFIHYTDPVLWQPGVQWATWWARASVPDPLKWILPALLGLAVLFPRARASSTHLVYVLPSTLFLIAYVLLPNLFHGFRDKELIAVQPLLSVLNGIGLAVTARQAVRLWAARSAAR